MAEKKDFYELLGIARGAKDDDIKRAYFKLAKKFHPDANPGDQSAEERFKEVNEAYQVLSDAKKRSLYDQYGHAAVDQAYAAKEGGGPRAGPFGGGAEFSGGFSDVFEDLFEGFFGGQQPGAARARGRSSPRGTDLRYDLEVTFRESIFGVEKHIEVPRAERCVVCQGTGAKEGRALRECPACHGAGQVRYASGFFSVSQTCERCHGNGRLVDEACATCRGEGRVKKTRRLSVKIPGGIENGSRLRVSGEGEAGPRGGSSGDLYVMVHVHQDEFFEREGDDLACEVPVSYVQAALGAEVEVPTLEGKVLMKVPAGTQSGKVFRLRGRGIPNINGYGRGDQLVRVVVEVPKSLSEKQKALLTEFAKAMGESSQPMRATFVKKMKDMFGV